MSTGLTGRWEMIKAELAGENAPYMLALRVVLELTSVTYAVSFAGQVADRGTYVLAGETLTLTGTEGPNQGRKFYAVGEKLYRAGKSDGSVPACQACHGPTGTGVPGAYPALGGQHAQYTTAKLTAFRGGQVWGQAD